MRWRAVAGAVLWVLLAGAGGTVELVLPESARQTLSRDSALKSVRVPVGIWDGSDVPSTALEGRLRTRAWRIDAAALTPLQMIAPLRAQLEAGGFEIVLDCAAARCGGFDFRFALDVLPAPEMIVNLRSYHVITALKGPVTAPVEAVTLIASARSGSGHLQMTQAVARDTGRAVQPVVTADTSPADGALTAALDGQGHAVLEGLDFGSGTATLREGVFPVLAELAQILQARPAMRVALVGHTDNVGSLDTNIRLSRARARSVRQRLIDEYGIAADRLEGEGMGYLAPLTTNATQAGRDANRRVEVVLLSE